MRSADAFDLASELLVALAIGFLLLMGFDAASSYAYVVKTLKDDPMIHFDEYAVGVRTFR